MATSTQNAPENLADTKQSRRNLKWLTTSSPDAFSNLQRASSRYITVEPILWLIFAGFGVVIQVFPQYVQSRVAMERNLTLPESDGANDSECNIMNTSDPYYIGLQQVQADVAFWLQILEVCHRLPAIFVSPILGTWSDIVGRKIVLGLNAFGFVIFGLAFVLTYHLALPVWVICLGFCVAGMFGGLGLLFSESFAYISDVTTKENRLLRIGVTTGVNFLMLGGTTLGVGFFITDFGYGAPLWMMNILFFAAFLYVIIPGLLIETVDRSKKRGEKLIGNVKSSAKRVLKELKLLLQHNKYMRRWRLILLYTIDFMREILEQSNPLIFVYALGPPFCWTSVVLGGYATVVLAGNALAVTLGAKGINIFLSDLWTLQCSMIFNILYGFLHAIANSTSVLYVAGFIGAFRNIIQSLIPAMLAKTVTEDEHGVVFAINASVQNLGSLVCPILLNSVYYVTVQSQPNFVFYLIGIIGIIPLILTTCLIRVKPFNNTRLDLHYSQEQQAVLGLLSQAHFHQCNMCKETGPPPTFYVIFPEPTIKNPPASKVKLPPPLQVLSESSPHFRSVCLNSINNSIIVNNWTTTMSTPTSGSTSDGGGILTSRLRTSPATTTDHRHLINITTLPTSPQSSTESAVTVRRRGNRNELAFIVLLLVIPVFIFVLVYKRAKIAAHFKRKNKQTPPVKYSSVRTSSTTR